MTINKETFFSSPFPAMEMMRMFVLANSLVLFVTVAWPSMKQSYQVVMEMLYGEEEEKAEL